MTIVIWLLIGAAIGFAATLVLAVWARMRLIINLAAGMAGALAGGIAEAHGRIPPSPWDMNGLIVASASAVILLGIVNLFQRSPAG